MTQQIGRFRLLRSLEESSQYLSYLAEDSHSALQLVLVLPKGAFPEPSELRVQLIRALEAIRGLQHQHLVSLLGAGIDGARPYLCYSPVEGETLAQVLVRERHLTHHRAAQITMDVLDGLATLHMRNFVHGALDPSCILFDEEGAARIRCAGLATVLALAERRSSESSSYMPAECPQSETMEYSCDLYAVGAILVEMITGVPPAHIGMPMHELVSLTALQPQIEPELDGIVLSALCSDQDKSFSSASQMRAALESYLSRSGEHGKPVAESAIEEIVERMKRKPGFPAFADSVSTINRVATSESDGAMVLAQAISHDVALVSSLLKLANSPIYGINREINDLSRAVVVLGFDTVRNLALTLVLSNPSKYEDNPAITVFYDEFLITLLAGALARRLIGRAARDEVEQAYIGAIYYNLGKLLALYYFPEDARHVTTLVSDGILTESQAAVHVFKISYESFGLEMASQWHFHVRIINCMKRYPAGPVPAPAERQEYIRMIINMASEIIHTVADNEGDQRDSAIESLMERYRAGVTLEIDELRSMIRQAMRQFREDASHMRLGLDRSETMIRISDWLTGIDSARYAQV